MPKFNEATLQRASKRDTKTYDILCDMSLEERTLLFYLEICAVEEKGKIPSELITDEMVTLMMKWHSTRFIEFKTVYPDATSKGPDYYCKLSSEACHIASIVRLYKAETESHWNNQEADDAT